GSIAAYVGALGASLGGMVANLSSHKRGWDDRWESYSQWAEKGQILKDQLLQLVDADTQAFEGVMAAFRLPKGTDEEKAARATAIEEATKAAIATPFRTLEVAAEIFPLCQAMAESGLPASVSDAGVGALCARAAMRGAYLNVQINTAGLKDEAYKKDVLERGRQLLDEAERAEAAIMAVVTKKL
ncbi:MAG: cyclodeaminase/cyclohydrolase family protein, partial [Lewinella sp.]|nr:cyclodeaminase/cyclohydrolase family protein [Lewinella sp.]